MKVELQLKVSCPIKTLSPITIPISAIINQKIDIKIVGNCKCSVKNGVADISIEAKLTAASGWIPDKLLDRGRDAVEALIVDNIVKPLKKNRSLIEAECKIDNEIINL